MGRVLILYASKEGQTEQVATFLAQVLRDRSHQVAVTSFDSEPELTGIDAVVVGASVHVGRHPEALGRYLRARCEALNGRVSAFFSVSLSEAEGDPESHARALGYIQTFLEETGWRPDLRASFAGALRYSRYNFFTRQLMKHISKQGNLSDDTEHDHEYTDWGEVTRFGLALAEVLMSPEHVTS